MKFFGQQHISSASPFKDNFKFQGVFFCLDFSTMNTAFSPGDCRFCGCHNASQKFVLESE